MGTYSKLVRSNRSLSQTGKNEASQVTKAAQQEQVKARVSPKKVASKPSKKHQTIRRAYDLYTFQVDQLHRVRATRELSSKKRVSISALVREAVDLLLEKEGLEQ